MVSKHFVKVLRPDAYPTGIDALHAQQALAIRASGFSVGIPFARLDQCHALILDAAPGESLGRLVTGAGWERAARSTGQALAALHACAVPPGRHHGRDALLAKVRRNAMLLCWACPNLARDIQRVVQALQHCPDPTEANPTHLDLKPEHVILDCDRERTTFIDLDNHAHADPALDVGALTVRLDPEFACGRGTPAQGASDAFLEAYLASVPGSRRLAVGPARAAALLQVAVYAVQHLRPEWPSRVAAAITAAEQVVWESGG